MKQWKRTLAIMLTVLLLVTNTHNFAFASDDMEYGESDSIADLETYTECKFRLNGVRFPLKAA